MTGDLPRDEQASAPEPGMALQQERTALAWDRTGLGLIVAGGLFVRAGGPPYGDLRHAPGLGAMLAGAALLLFAYRRYERFYAHVRSGVPVTSPPVVVATGIVTVLFAIAALVLVAAGG